MILVLIALIVSCKFNRINDVVKGGNQTVSNGTSIITTSNYTGFVESLGVVKRYSFYGRSLDFIKVVGHERGSCVFSEGGGRYLFGRCYDRKGYLIRGDFDVQDPEGYRFHNATSDFIELLGEKVMLLNINSIKGPYLYLTSLENNGLSEQYTDLSGSLDSYLLLKNIVKIGNNRFLIIYFGKFSGVIELRGNFYEIYEDINKLEVRKIVEETGFISGISNYSRYSFKHPYLEGVTVENKTFIAVSSPITSPDSNANYIEYKYDIASLDFEFEDTKKGPYIPNRGIANFETIGVQLGGRLTKNSRDEIFLTYTTDNKAGFVRGFRYEDNERKEWLTEIKVEEFSYVTPMTPLYI